MVELRVQVNRPHPESKTQDLVSELAHFTVTVLAFGATIAVHHSPGAEPYWTPEQPPELVGTETCGTGTGAFGTGTGVGDDFGTGTGVGDDFGTGTGVGDDFGTGTGVGACGVGATSTNPVVMPLALAVGLSIAISAQFQNRSPCVVPMVLASPVCQEFKLCQ